MKYIYFLRAEKELYGLDENALFDKITYNYLPHIEKNVK